MKYELIDLGRPAELTYAKAFIVTQENKYFMVKGGYSKVTNRLENPTFPCFFGKIELHQHSNKSINLISKGFSLVHLLEGNRPYFRFVSENGILFKKTRRLPDKWLDCINTDERLDLMAASDLLEERGMLVGAIFLRHHVQLMTGRKQVRQSTIVKHVPRRRRLAGRGFGGV